MPCPRLRPGKSLRFADYTFLKEGEKNGGYNVLLWRNSTGSNVTLYPNLTTKDPVWRALNRDVRYRRALSLAIDRHQINQVVFFGLAHEGANSVLPASPLFKADYQNAYAIHDVKDANRLLDEIGLTKRDSDGFRLLPDGRPLTVIVDTSGLTSEEPDVLELIRGKSARVAGGRARADVGCPHGRDMPSVRGLRGGECLRRPEGGRRIRLQRP